MKRDSVFEPDDSHVGDMTYRRKDYEVIQRALKLLLKTVRHWDEVATFNGATEPPYAAFEDHLANMVSWGERKLKDQDALRITVDGISVGSLGLQRAALEFAAAKAEQDAKEKSKGTPPAVADSLFGQARGYAAEAKKIEHPAHPILNELMHDLRGQENEIGSGRASHEWDVFISHASEDKDTIARPLAEALRAKGLKVWFDEAELTLGDSLRQSIDRGLARSRYGIVILSEAFFSKHWPRRELDGLDAREVNGVKVILPVWHGVDQAAVARHSPMLAGRMAVSSSRGFPAVVEEILKALRR